MPTAQDNPGGHTAAAGRWLHGIRTLASVAVIMALGACAPAAPSQVPPLASSSPAAPPASGQPPLPPPPPPPPPPATPSVERPEPLVPSLPAVHTEKLGTGLSVWIAERTAVPVVHLVLVLRAGTLDDRPGVARLAAQLVADGGATAQPGAGFGRAIAALGAELEQHTTLDSTVFRLSVNPSQLDAALQLLGEMLGGVLRSPGRSFSTARKLAMARANARAREARGLAAEELLSRWLLDDTSTRRRTRHATRRELSRVRFSHCRRFYEAHYGQDAATLLVVGDVSAAAVAAAATKAFANTRRRPASPTRPAASQTTAAAAPSGHWVALFDDTTGPGSTIHVGWSVPQTTAANLPTQAMMVQLFTAADGSFLADRLGQLATGLRAQWIMRARQPALLLSEIDVPTERSAEAVAIVLQAMADFAAQPAAAARLDTAQQGLLEQLWRTNETTEAIADKLADLPVLGLAASTYSSYGPQLQATTAQGVQTLASAAAQIPPRLVVVGDGKRLAATLTRFGVVRIVDPVAGYAILKTFRPTTPP